MKEHPDDFHMRIEYVLHAFNRLSEHCDYKSPTEIECYHPSNKYGCFVNDCPLLRQGYDEGDEMTARLTHLVSLPDGMKHSKHSYRGGRLIEELEYKGCYAVIDWDQRWWQLGCSLYAPPNGMIERGTANHVKHEPRYTKRGWRDRLLADAVGALQRAMGE
jgi:hypothetical protein